MRRKNNLDQRLIECKNYFCNDIDEPLDTRKASIEITNINWVEIFGNNNPIHLEIGCGKGGFINDLAKLNPNINFIAVERLTNVIIGAVELSKANNLENIRYLNTRCENMPRYINESQISKIYLNFSNPLPNSRNERQRLTYPRFLELYSFLLIKGGQLCQRTDNKEFFDYSVAQFEKSKFFDIEKVDNNLDSIIKTEHESRFLQLGRTIYGVTVCNKK